MMGQIENVTHELESNIMEHPKAPESLVEDPKCEHLTSDNLKMDPMSLATGTVAQKEVNGAQNVEKKLSSTEERPERVAVLESTHEQISDSIGVKKQDQPELESTKSLSISENVEVESQNGRENENLGMISGGTFVSSGNGLLKSLHADEVGGSGHLHSEDIELSGQLRRRNTKAKVLVTSSWKLRSKSQDKTKALEPNDSMKEGNTSDEKKRRGRKKMRMKKNNVNEFSRTRTHLRYLLHRIKYEQNLIDAYSAEGWKGQSLEKLKPEKELQRAKSHIIVYKLKIRALFQHLDQLLAAGKLPASLFDSQGEIDSEDIFCAKCGSKDVTLDNDIILCDGACERGFHQFCLEPPLLKEDIPPGDEGWLCPGCDCKVDCIDMLKDFQGTKITITDRWEKIFPEAAEAASGNKLLDGSRSASVSDDSEDDDYDPDKPNNDEKVEEDESSSDESSNHSASDDLAACNNDKGMELASDDSEDDDFDPSAVAQAKQVKEDSSSSDFTSDSEDLGALLEDETAPDADSEKILPPLDPRYPTTGSKEENSKVGKKKKQSLKDELSYLMETGSEPLSGRRPVERLDYKTLNDETYGDSSSDSSDEDFDDPTAKKRRRTDHEKTVVLSPNRIPITMSTTDTNDETPKESKHSSKRTRKANESPKDDSCSAGTKKSVYHRLGEAVTQRLYASFYKNQYPDRASKENLAKELGLTIRQVSKWFENARWSFNHRPQVESTPTKTPPEPQPNIPNIRTDNTSSIKQPQESSANASQETRAEHFIITTAEENSGTIKSRKMNDKSKLSSDNVKTEDQNVSVDTQSPQVRRNIRRTRSGNSIA